ncbi:outer membrane lipoprotein carrier protein LolA, partial [Rhizobium ruizarguesonis]
MSHSDTFLSGLAVTRRDLLGAFAVAAMASAIPLGAYAQAAAPAYGTAQAIADHFSGVTTMQGEVVQFGPRGEQTGGKFFIQ